MGYHFKVRIYPHNVLRENKQATGAGADRVSQGMRSAFGKAVGTAARVKKGQKILTVYTTKQHIDSAIISLKRALYKLPMPCGVIVEEKA
jgi:large subunit ribosomal protein L10e